MPTRRARRRAGFTVIELLVVVTIILLLAGLLVTTAFTLRKRAKIAAARVDIQSLSMALSFYHRQFFRYPPDRVTAADHPADPAHDLRSASDDAGELSNEFLVYYLGRRLSHGANFLGPYMEFSERRLEDGDDPSDGFPVYRDPWGGLYHYVRDDANRSFVLVSPGPDGALGGTITPGTGFTETVACEAEDNITSWEK